jgi:hypothetical protein
MENQFFKGCRTLQEVKRRYKELAMLHHPDKGGKTETMQQINKEYESIIKNPFFSFDEQPEEDREEFIKYPEIINRVIGLEGILIELMGNWIWISGNTYPHRQNLKASGFFFAPKKVMWYYRPPDYKSNNRKPKTIEYIRQKYGSEVILTKVEKMSLIK